jgi:hypothetical protein
MVMMLVSSVCHINLNHLKTRKSENIFFFYVTLRGFRKKHCFLKFPRLRLFVLLVTEALAECLWQRKSKYSEINLVPLPQCRTHISNGLSLRSLPGLRDDRVVVSAKVTTRRLKININVCRYIYIGFKTFFYVVRHLDSTASYLPTGLHLGFFRSWPSIYLPSILSSVFLVLSFVSAFTSMLYWVIFLQPFSSIFLECLEHSTYRNSFTFFELYVVY